MNNQIRPFFEGEFNKMPETELADAYNYLHSKSTNKLLGLPHPSELIRLENYTLRQALMVLFCMMIMFTDMVVESQETATPAEPEFITELEERYQLTLTEGERILFTEEMFSYFQNPAVMEAYFQMRAHCDQIADQHNLDIRVGFRPLYLFSNQEGTVQTEKVIPVALYCVSPNQMGDTLNINTLSPFTIQISHYLNNGYAYRLFSPQNSFTAYLDETRSVGVNDGLFAQGDSFALNREHIAPTTGFDEEYRTPISSTEIQEIVMDAIRERGIQSIVKSPVAQVEHRTYEFQLPEADGGVRMHLFLAEVGIDLIEGNRNYVFPQAELEQIFANSQIDTLQIEANNRDVYIEEAGQRILLYGPVSADRQQWRVTYMLIEGVPDTNIDYTNWYVAIGACLTSFLLIGTVGGGIAWKYRSEQKGKSLRTLKEKQPAELDVAQFTQLVTDVAAKLPNYLTLELSDFIKLLKQLILLASDFVQEFPQQSSALLSKENPELLSVLMQLNLRDIKHPHNLINQLTSAYFQQLEPKSNPQQPEQYNTEVSAYNNAYRRITLEIESTKNILNLLNRLEPEKAIAIDHLNFSLSLPGNPPELYNQVDVSQLPDHLAAVTGVERLRKGGAKEIISSIIANGRIELTEAELRQRLNYSKVEIRPSQNKESMVISYEHNAGTFTFVFSKGTDDVSISWQPREG